MKLHTVFITWNRLELTQQAITSYLETVSVPYTYIVVDNASSDGTKEWLNKWDHPYHALSRNRYPGYATNLGWDQAPADADFLHRADNDFAFLKGWCEEVERKFRQEKMGQVGLRTHAQEPGAPYNVGGNCVIRRELWERGLRYDETPWPELSPGFTEDSFFSPEIRKMGYEWSRVSRQCIFELAEVYESTNTDPYYEASWGSRHLYGRTPH